MKQITLFGSKAYSDFRINNLIEKTKKRNLSYSKEELSPDTVFFLKTGTELNSKEKQQINALLDLNNKTFNKKNNGFFVIPRKGTISPWSSKASDIFSNCGLNNILRVEHGLFFNMDLQKAKPVLDLIHDKMTEGVYINADDIFSEMKPGKYIDIDILSEGIEALEKVNVSMGLALSREEIEYLYNTYKKANKNPSDVELLMFGQVNSEHCRHKIFNADWIVDGEQKPKSLFKMIKNTFEKNNKGVVVAYSDNSCVIEGGNANYFEAQRHKDNIYTSNECFLDIIAKVETHNHPTAISPYPGAATGVGGEIRDEGATGTGSKTKAGLCGFIVSNLKVPDFIMPWEKEFSEFPSRIASPFEIMIEGPIGGANFGNEFGRPQLSGFFRTYEEFYNNKFRAYHKPIMLAGGMGNIKRQHSHKKDIESNALIIQIGGPAMKIGIGGGAASSMDTGSNDENLDFNSVQRGNAEMERRCQEVIDSCIALDDANPLLSIHDIGAGGLSNACPELVAETGADFRLRNIHNEDLSMSPMEIWCCEAQERYVLAINEKDLDLFSKICERERCPMAVIGKANTEHKLRLYDEHFDNHPIDIDIGVILHKPPRMLRNVEHKHEKHIPFDFSNIGITESIKRVLQVPSVANKTFLISITDRTITGMVHRDQMVGPYQSPVADNAVTSRTLDSFEGEAMAIGERCNIAVVSAPASCRMAIGELITNIAGTFIGDIGNIKISANWMCACGEDGEDANLYDSVKSVGEELCPQLGICIPVGKDSLSMRSVWNDSKGNEYKAISPLSLIASGFSPVKDIRKTVTPEIKDIDSSLFLIDLGNGKNRISCSALAQAYNQAGNNPPDLDNPKQVVNFFNAVQELLSENKILAYHDKSDGGLFTCIAEMCFASRLGISIDISDHVKTNNNKELLSVLFNEELGAVLQVSDKDLEHFKSVINKYDLVDIVHKIGKPEKTGQLFISSKESIIYKERISKLNRYWSELTYMMQHHRDNPVTAKQEYDLMLDENDPGLNFKLTYNPEDSIMINTGVKPKMAILREQGINGHIEMAYAFNKAGFESVDVHMTDLINSRVDLNDFNGFVACGGFSYGDVLGSGSGWAKSILFNDRLKNMFKKFFNDKNKFALGVCNGCQMISQLKEIIPGAQHWPFFTQNISGQFEARYISVEILESPSIFFKDMTGSVIPVPVAHGDGHANFNKTGSYENAVNNKLVSMRYVDNYGKATEIYPLNPNGSMGGITSLTNSDGRITVMMPHPERLFRAVQMSYRPDKLFTGENGPWMKIFNNARDFVS